MKRFGRFLGGLLLFALLWERGVGIPTLMTPTKAKCNLSPEPNIAFLTEMKAQLMKLDGSSSSLLALYNKAQGAPFPSRAEKLCNRNQQIFPPFRKDGMEEDKWADVVHITLYFENSLNTILQDQKALNPNNKNLLHSLSSTAQSLHELRDTVLTYLHCEDEGLKSHPLPGLRTPKDIFQKKLLGCQCLWKYKELIATLAQAF
ncbi:leukemia inhibitory factor-like [Tenrec ecaudatus]|uniref:leukemia inhibitory factor-like n=1 Tax=Tenrec ecaudatus TaxID=94439 RepID=UPI003F59D4F8